VLILREIFFGRRRFDEMASASASPATSSRQRSTARRGGRADEGRLPGAPERFEYRLTEKGLDLWPVMVTLMQFGDRYYAPDGPPIVLTHRECGGTLDAHRICGALRRQADARDVPRRTGPGGSERGKLLLQRLHRREQVAHDSTRASTSSDVNDDAAPRAVRHLVPGQRRRDRRAAPSPAASRRSPSSCGGRSATSRRTPCRRAWPSPCPRRRGPGPPLEHLRQPRENARVSS
jgi:DNA-binding HxlR family transcriptional regulator